MAPLRTAVNGAVIPIPISHTASSLAYQVNGWTPYLQRLGESWMVEDSTPLPLFAQRSTDGGVMSVDSRNVPYVNGTRDWTGVIVPTQGFAHGATGDGAGLSSPIDVIARMQAPYDALFANPWTPGVELSGAFGANVYHQQDRQNYSEPGGGTLNCPVNKWNTCFWNNVYPRLFVGGDYWRCPWIGENTDDSISFSPGAVDLWTHGNLNLPWSIFAAFNGYVISLVDFKRSSDNAIFHWGYQLKSYRAVGFHTASRAVPYSIIELKLGYTPDGDSSLEIWECKVLSAGTIDPSVMINVAGGLELDYPELNPLGQFTGIPDPLGGPNCYAGMTSYARLIGVVLGNLTTWKSANGFSQSAASTRYFIPS